MYVCAYVVSSRERTNERMDGWMSGEGGGGVQEQRGRRRDKMDGWMENKIAASSERHEESWWGERHEESGGARAKDDGGGGCDKRAGCGRRRDRGSWERSKQCRQTPDRLTAQPHSYSSTDPPSSPSSLAPDSPHSSPTNTTAPSLPLPLPRRATRYPRA
ncbi:hypothetical protein B0H16DRAFT_715340 [Mycena metata]|uniref:Uncharacterized protein n=1 Tax=Mycena metata TaxID=1033252 RepID=A0AAD7NDA3_9AGAR|nr:hypothetical protein B0H16DRAFT_715340 [Mycena metata]